MSNIRTFQNSDLPALQRVWVAHWSRLGPPPVVTIPIIEQAILSRTFFDPQLLFMAVIDQQVQAWCHCSLDPSCVDVAVVSGFCFADADADCRNQLLAAAESKLAEAGCNQLLFGSVRDQIYGYAGLPPVGHGFGVDDRDAAMAALLSERGYQPLSSALQLIVAASSFRMPVSRDLLQIRRGSRTVVQAITPGDQRLASATSHLDVERHTLVDSRTGSELEQIELWVSDPEAQVMPPSGAILDLGSVDGLSPAQMFLIGSVIQTVTSRGIRTLETVVDSERQELIDQLAKLQFHAQQRGTQWQKSI